jgi:putative oxidoreductase
MTIDDRRKYAWIVLRVTLAVLIAIHGWHRFFSDGAITEWGASLSARGFPFGVQLAGTVTGLEMFASLIFASGYAVAPLSLVYAFIYSMGIMLHHLPNGWFSSGSDADGCEYPVLLIIAFLCTGFQHGWPARFGIRTPLFRAGSA